MIIFIIYFLSSFSLVNSLFIPNPNASKCTFSTTNPTETTSNHHHIPTSNPAFSTIFKHYFYIDADEDCANATIEKRL